MSAAREARLPPDTLDAIEAEAWTLLEAGGRSFRAPFHSGQIAIPDLKQYLRGRQIEVRP